MDPRCEHDRILTRRQLLGKAASGVGSAALAWLLQGELGAVTGPHFAPRAKRVIFLFQFGGPAQMELFDHKPALWKHHGIELPDSVRRGAPISGLTKNQKSLPIVAPFVKFRRHGKSGLWMSDLIPHIASVADRIAVIKTMETDIVAHDPALRFMQTGSQMAGKPSSGSWASYGLGREGDNLPAYVVFISDGSGGKDTQPLAARLWGNGFLPSSHQGVQFRRKGDPVLYLSDPPGIDMARRRRMLDALSELNGIQESRLGDPEIRTRIAQYELAFRMQRSVPELLDLKDEPKSVFELYGPDSRKKGTYAYNCLLARRMAERGVRFVQLFHRGWDQHGDLPKQIRGQCRDTDRATAALVKDLDRRGLLDETLIIWGGEFGRTAYCQGKLAEGKYGRDHHGRCFSMWLAGGGIRGGVSIGETDDLCYNVVRDPVHIRDLHATILHCLGIDHKRLTFRFQGLDHRLTGVEGEARVVREILA